MSFSKIAKAKDAAHRRRMEKLTPKQRFKTLSKEDQYILAARTLAHHVGTEKKRTPAKRSYIHGWTFTLSGLKPSLIDIDPASGLISQSSMRKIKRAVANTFRKSLGPDGVFLFSIEQRDKTGRLTEPHVHGAYVGRLDKILETKLKARLERLSRMTTGKAVETKLYTKNFGKRNNELAEAEADIRRWAAYLAKNKDTHYYRSRALLRLLHERFEELKRHYLKL